MKIGIGIGNLTTIAAAFGLAAFSSVGCGDTTSPADEKSVARAMQESLKADLTTLHQGAVELQAAAPTPTGRGWSATTDAAAITAMKTAWIKARTAYEHIEGAVAPIFPETDLAIDERYDGFLEGLPAGDSNLFDGQGVTGMHAIERVLWADAIPTDVVAFESGLTGYKAAAFPATETEAATFKSGLAAQLATDTQGLLTQWTAAATLDVPGAFQGLIGLMNEQGEKVSNAAGGIEESRYSQRTMADLRANLEGTKTIYGLFRDWLKTKPAAGTAPSGTTVDAAIMNAFRLLDTTYAAVAGPSIPAPPATWDSANPSAPDLQTPFGMLYQVVHQVVDPSQAGSMVGQMNQAAMLLGIPGFEE